MKSCVLVFLVLLGLAPGPAAAQGLEVGVRGYAKNLGVRAASFFTGEPYVLNISRLRTRGVLGVGTALHAEVYLDTELLAGSFLGTDDFALGQAAERTTWLDLDWTLRDGHRHRLQQRLFRAFATAYVGQAHLTLGRQRIAWGTGFAWNPTDLLNPFNPAGIELDEKAGVDAVYMLVPLGTASRIEAVAAPGRRRRDASAALRLGSHLGEYDVTVMAGTFRRDLVLGGDFAGYLGDAGLRGEAAYTVADEGGGYLRAVLNADYNIAAGYYFLVELYFNGQGTRDKAAYDVSALLEGRAFNVAKDYAAASVAKAVTPLLAVSVYSLVNLDDQSSLAGPSLTYSLAENLELALATYLFLGAPDTEFGAQEHLYFGSLQWYF